MYEVTHALNRPDAGTLLDWSHPSTDRLRFALLLNDYGVPLNGTGYAQYLPSLGAAAGWAGDVLNLDGTSTSYLDLGANTDLTGELTVLTRFITDSVTGLRTLWGCNTSGGAERLAGSRYIESSLLSYWEGTGNDQVLNGAKTIVTGTWYTDILVRAGAASAWTMTSYIDGVQDDTNTSGRPAPSTSSAGNLRCGMAGAYTGAMLDGRVGLFMVWARAMNPNEAMALSLDPFQLWQQPVPIQGKAAAAGSFNAAWAGPTTSVVGSGVL